MRGPDGEIYVIRAKVLADKYDEATQLRAKFPEGDEPTVWSEEDCSLCECGATITPDDVGHKIVQIGFGWRCVGEPK